jgi:hypothetical protein
VNVELDAIMEHAARVLAEPRNTFIPTHRWTTSSCVTFARSVQRPRRMRPHGLGTPASARSSTAFARSSTRTETMQAASTSTCRTSLPEADTPAPVRLLPQYDRPAALAQGPQPVHPCRAQSAVPRGWLIHVRFDFALPIHGPKPLDRRTTGLKDNGPCLRNLSACNSPAHRVRRPAALNMASVSTSVGTRINGGQLHEINRKAVT